MSINNKLHIGDIVRWKWIAMDRDPYIEKLSANTQGVGMVIDKTDYKPGKPFQLRGNKHYICPNDKGATVYTVYWFETKRVVDHLEDNRRRLKFLNPAQP